MKPHIKFSVMWDKLRQPRFTTIRSYRRDKEAFYQSRLGETFTLLKVPHEFAHPSKGRKIGEATLVRVKEVHPKEMDVTILLEDVRLNGHPDVRWLERIAGMDEGLLLEFENHTGLMGDV